MATRRDGFATGSCVSLRGVDSQLRADRTREDFRYRKCVNGLVDRFWLEGYTAKVSTTPLGSIHARTGSIHARIGSIHSPG